MSIEVRNLRKSYGSVVALDDVSFVVERGSVTGFLGPNGAGKTTTMKIITGILEPDSGEVFIDGIEKSAEQLQTRKRIGYLPENNPLYTGMFVRDYLRYMARLSGVDASLVNKSVEHVIDLCAIGSQANKRIGELSKGYRQRVGLAQALVHNPDILILDEPTNGLDPNQVIEIRQLIKDIAREKTVMLSSHVLAEIENLCRRVIIIDKGKIIADALASDLKKFTTGNIVLKIKVKNSDRLPGDFLDKTGALSVEKTSANSFVVRGNREDLAEKIFIYAAQNNLILTELAPWEEKLEDVFHRLTAQ